MSLINTIKGVFLGREGSGQEADTVPKTSPVVRDLATSIIDAHSDVESASITIAMSVSIGESNAAFNATSEQLSSKLDDYAYVLAPVTPAEDAFSPWFIGDKPNQFVSQRKRTNRDWTTPFLSPQVAALPTIWPLLEHGVNRHQGIAVALRALIREKRKAKEAHRELLDALYGTAVLTDFLASLECERLTFFSDLTQFVSFDELMRIRCKYSWMGYARISSLKKTDVKWLQAEFGEPSVHHSFGPLWNTLRRDAIRRYCRAEVMRASRTPLSMMSIEEKLPQVLSRKIEFSIEIDNENRARATATATRYERREEGPEDTDGAWIATSSDFIVADIETTGLDANVCEILEIAALLVNPQGLVVQEFSTLIQVRSRIPAFISELTGISQVLVDTNGKSERDALGGFASFVGQRPIFFHNATFDTKFLIPALSRHGLGFLGPVFDTLPIARAAWPEMRSHKLATLVKIIEDGPVPAHRALPDARAALAVLLAARKIAGRCPAPMVPTVLGDSPIRIWNM